MSAAGSLWRLPEMRRLVALSVLGFSSFSLTLAALPLWAVAGGAGLGSAGLVTAALLTATVLVQAFVPTMVARLGLPRVFALGLIALGAPAPFYLLDHDLSWLLVVSALRGFGFAVLTVLGATMTARVAPPSRHGESVGIYGLAVAVPNLLAVPAGVALTLADRFSWVAILAVAPLLALPLVRGLAGSGEAGIPEATGGSGAAVRAAVGPSAVLLVVTLAGGGLVTFLPIERPDGALAGAALLVFGATGALSRWRVGLLGDRLGTRVLLPLSLAAACVGLLVVAAGLMFSRGATGLLIAGAAVFGVGYGAVQNLTLVVAFDRAGREHTTTSSAVWNAAFDAGTAIGAFAVGAVAAAGLGLAWTYVGCVLLIALTLPVALAVIPRRR